MLSSLNKDIIIIIIIKSTKGFAKLQKHCKKLP